MAQHWGNSLIFAIRHPRKVFANTAVIRFEKTASRLTAILMPLCCIN